ncbi:antitoxin [Frankia sp. CNm7]|uniref:Antitoxin n=1 Tax=Frankia nepalensis TaxID=1836974 RepID=A0A937RJ63_9ACTN|nr:antitoxin [Frankia nepalensis]MBL7500415.1 antitoxin [Frankia nepalensis]MBL7511098.1 antitoxin [Frankia nepalensis]MBL7519782.1 antitoxin [Frankia nepalensis]MBL7626936.1 antitoxin [Frankia nepalensis]
MFDNLKDLADKAGDLKEKAEDLAEKHGDQINDGLDKAGDFVDDRTGGKYSDKIDTGVEQGQKLVERLGDQAS